MNANDSLLAETIPLKIHLKKLYLRLSFECKIKAIVETQLGKTHSSFVKNDISGGEVIFNETVSTSVPRQGSHVVKIVLIILKGNNTKMVGHIIFDLDNDPIKEKRNHKYVLQKCPQKHVRLKLDYEFGDDLKSSERKRVVSNRGVFEKDNSAFSEKRIFFCD